MQALRSLLFNTLFWINTCILSIAILLLRPFGLKASYSIGRLWSRTNMFLLKIICNITYDVRIKGELPKEPAIYISNHQSAWETIAFPSFIPPFMWVLKKELFYIPFFGWCLIALGHIGIDRKSGSKAIKEINQKGKKLLEKGYNVVIFPEGTRRAPGELGPFNPGGVGLAVKRGVPIVPVIQNAGTLWGKKAFGKKAGKISVVIEEPILTANASPAERRKISEKVRAIIARELDHLED